MKVSKALRLELCSMLAGCILLAACGEGANNQVSSGSSEKKQTETNTAMEGEKQTEITKQTEEVANKEEVELEWYLALSINGPGKEDVFKKGK